MCKICEQYYEGENLLALRDEYIPFGYNESAFLLTIWMNDSKLQAEICCPKGDFNILEVNIPIKYCPFCGEQLKEIVEDEEEL